MVKDTSGSVLEQGAGKRTRGLESRRPDAGKIGSGEFPANIQMKPLRPAINVRIYGMQGVSEFLRGENL